MTNDNPCTPVHLTDVVRLAGTRPITIRPTTPQDLVLQKAFFRLLSPQRRYLRFLTRFDELPPLLAERFASIDHKHHLALMAEVFSGDRNIMIGEARYVTDRADPTACEFAIAVADDWAHKGLARALLERLEQQAVANGIRHMHGETLLCNRAMISLAMRSGYIVKADPKDAMLAQLDKVLRPSAIPQAQADLAA